jgi:hypothetical protein
VNPLNNEIKTGENPENLPVAISRTILSIQEYAEIIKQQDQFINEYLRESKDNGKTGDYGIMPGTRKKALYEPGAEKLAFLWNADPECVIVNSVVDFNRPIPFFHYEVRCDLYRLGTRDKMGDAVASCNSLESKYRYRWVDQDKLPQGINTEGLLNKTETYGTKKVVKYRLVNEDTADLANTILQMAQKRAFVRVIRIVTRTSNRFESGEESHKNGNSGDGKNKGKSSTPPPNKTQGTGDPQKLKGQIYTHFKGDEDQVQDFLRKVLKVKGTVPPEKITVAGWKAVAAALEVLKSTKPDGDKPPTDKPGSPPAGKLKLGTKSVILLSYSKLSPDIFQPDERGMIENGLDNAHPNEVTADDMLNEADGQRIIKLIAHREKIAEVKELLNKCFPRLEKEAGDFVTKILELRNVDLDQLTPDQVTKLKIAVEKELENFPY